MTIRTLRGFAVSVAFSASNRSFCVSFPPQSASASNAVSPASSVLLHSGDTMVLAKEVCD